MQKCDERQPVHFTIGTPPDSQSPETLLGLGYLLCLHIISLMLRRPSLAMPVDTGAILIMLWGVASLTVHGSSVMSM